MVKLTWSLKIFLAKFHRQEYVLISFGHLELFTEDMEREYLEWLKTDEGRSYLKGGSNYKEVK